MEDLKVHDYLVGGSVCFGITLPLEHPTTSTAHWWKRPAVGILKCNVDGALFQDEHYSSFAVIVRDQTSAVIKGLVVGTPHY
ncbi:hypothetical protein PVK06_017785 [Gossypium arboreum]|uniref:Uncharacterized protein n=1 Tax=Gossypium arboreum TaxID=29729 RepID=A0ABR0Q3L1_GOSAR|nr:hypothetical protein PVK06_017785 [Gossypium arboreum]